MTDTPDQRLRWSATAWYHTATGLIDVEHQFEELADLQSIIERGPDWNCLDRIEIKLQRRFNHVGFTIEQSSASRF